ncbi:phage baseplate assembly protein V [Desulfovibrio oxamicus]|uniref:Phage baseplate assembly protein V n=1 Tax=Nitratidesulfovibrio oxamicus TaxID=32016 RepID=A0ABS0J504_9BACT|nr:phage baseplate assembly protein V [Nitratidesulfovibrio oxamicus]MBG3877496.1 phage baseplate assembly protein V [Nitratidesulfovibrio oxamicus]
MDQSTFARMTSRITRALHGMVARATVRRVDDGPKMQELQVGLLADELADGVERFQNYGFTAHPMPGAEGIAVFVGADRAHGVVIAVDDRRFRLTSLEPGEVAIYTDEGDTIHLMRDRRIKITTLHLEVDAEEDVTMTTKRYAVTATESATINTPSFTSRGVGEGTCASTMQGSLHVTDDATAGSVSLRHHTHKSNGTGVQTDQPLGG